MKWLVYFFFRAVIAFLSVLPDRGLYVISGAIRVLLLNILGYRKGVVNRNLINSFPELSPGDLATLRRKYYQNLADLLIESLASYGWRIERYHSHFKYVNPELLHEYIAQNRMILGVAAHTGNFELGAVLTQPVLGLPCYSVYRPLANPHLDRFIYKKRSSQGITLRSDKKTGELIDMMVSPSILFLIADQNPSVIAKAKWVQFLNQDTAFVHGPATIAKMHNMPIVYFEVIKIRQGYYECTLSKLIEHPADYSEEEIIQLYASKLETCLKKHQDDWLWSHKRWKWKREGDLVVRKQVY